jgi:hypothetical protein
MATASVTYTFVNNTAADADEVNGNFSDLVTFLNTHVVHKDASVAMTSILSLPASDPTTANQATRKSYVDAAAGAGALTSFSPSLATGTIGNGTLSGWYQEAGKKMFVRYRLVRGSTTSFASGLAFTIPNSRTSAAGSNQRINGLATDVSTGGVWDASGWISPSVTSIFALSPFASGFGSGQLTGWSNTVPFTWAASDVVDLSGWFEIA